MAEQFIFLVAERGERYQVACRIKDCNLTITCSCPAGVAGELCEHRLELLTGDARHVVSGNAGDVRDLGDYLPECDVWPQLERLIAAKRHLETAVDEFSRAKTALEKVMND